MENKKSKLYTKTGDKGTSSLYNGERVSKTSKYFKLLGDLDELNSFIGVAKSHWKDILERSDIKEYSAPGAGAMNYRHAKCVNSGKYYEWFNVNVLTEIQCNVMDISSFIATPPWSQNIPLKGNVDEFLDNWGLKVGFNEINITLIEKLIDRLDSLVPPIKNFVVPGNDILVSSIHVCRTVSRRCERSFLKFNPEYLGIYSVIDTQFENVKIYLNRLSDFFFVLSRFLAMTLDVQEDHYSKSKNIF